MSGAWKRMHTMTALLVVPAATVVVGRFLPSAIWAWLIVAALMGVLVVVAGNGINGLWRGVFIDERNYMSLSRLQTVIWTVIIVSGFVMAALVNMRLGRSDPLDIALPSELWALLGISATSLVGTPLIRTGKTQHTPDKDNFVDTLDELGFHGVTAGDITEEKRGRNLRISDSRQQMMDAATPGDTPAPAPPRSQGVVLTRTTPQQAQWSDIFRGEDTGNGAHLDLGKVQMFYFTLAVVVAYAVALGSAFVDVGNRGIAEFPALTGGIVALLGISHAAYLTNKVVDRP